MSGAEGLMSAAPNKDEARKHWGVVRQLTQKYGQTSPVDWEEADNRAYWTAQRALFPKLKFPE